MVQTRSCDAKGARTCSCMRAGRSMLHTCQYSADPSGSARRRIPILVEGERLRPNLTSLLGLADYVSMSAKFPQVPSPLRLSTRAPAVESI